MKNGSTETTTDAASAESSTVGMIWQQQ